MLNILNKLTMQNVVSNNVFLENKVKTQQQQQQQNKKLNVKTLAGAGN